MKKMTGFTRGVNLGGWLSQCDHTKERYDTFITEKDFKSISERNFDHVRVPVDYDLFETKDMVFKEENFGYIAFAIEMSKKYGLNMVLDLHRTLGYSFDHYHNEVGFFDSEDYQNNFYLIWEKLAEKFGSNSDMLAFEILNEVTDKEYCEKWNRISTECIKRIRKFAPDIKILLGGYYNNSIEALKDLSMPYDANIVYNFHFYEPLIFTHQGAYWIDTMDQSFRCPFEMPFSKYDELSKKYLCQAYRSFDEFDVNSFPDESYFDTLLSEAVSVAEERNVALYCGEYGVIDRADKAEAQKWFDCFHKVMDKYDIGRAVWSYKEMDFEISKDF